MGLARSGDGERIAERIRARCASGEPAAGRPVAMGDAGASGTHSLASSIVFSLFFMVSFVFVSIIVIVSLRTVQHVGGGWHAQRVDDACASRAAKVASALQSAFAPDVPAASRPTVSQWPVTRARQPSFDVSERVLRMRAQGRHRRGAHAWCVRDERTLHACARVQGAGQRVWVRHARRRLGEARCATCLLARSVLR